VTDTELDRLEALADARTVDAEVRAAFHQLADTYRAKQRAVQKAEGQADRYFARSKDEEARADDAEFELKATEEELDEAKEEIENLRDLIQGYIRERRDAEVLGAERCSVERYYTKLEQLA
jgi:chromosome segregation ATPase